MGDIYDLNNNYSKPLFHKWMKESKTAAALWSSKHKDFETF